MNLTPTRDEAERLEADGRVVLFRAGEQCVRCGPPYGHCPHTVPPAEFVEAAKPCETCRHRHMSMAFAGHGCDDCLDGQRRIAAVVLCDCHCHDADDGFAEWDCRCDDGLVTVGHVVVEWGPWPVVGVDWGGNPGLIETGCVLIFRSTKTGQTEAMRAVLREKPDLLTLPPGVDPATLVGQYALGIRKVET